MTVPLELLTAQEPFPPVPRARPAEEPSGLVIAVMAGDEMLRRGVDGLLRAVPEVNAVRTCTHPEELSRLAQHERLDVVIVAADAYRLAYGSDLLARADVTVLVLVDPTSIEDLSGYPLGAGGFLWQPELTVASLRDSLRRCRNGDMPIPPDLLRALLGRGGAPVRRPRTRPVNLTGRERETLSLLVVGLSNKEIAKRLSISSNGAKRLVASIMLKLDAPNRTAAAVMAVRAGIVQAE